MPDLTPLFHKVKDALEESGLTMTESYIGMTAVIIHRIFSKSAVDTFINSPGVPPTGPDTSGDCHEPEVQEPPLVTGKAASGVRRPGAASTRKGK